MINMENKIAAEMSSETIGTFDETMADLQKYIKVLKSIQRTAHKALSRLNGNEDWNSIVRIVQDVLDRIEDNQISPDRMIDENLQVIESAKTTVQCQYDCLSKIQDLIQDAANLASKLSRSLYFDLHLPYDLIQDHLESVSKMLHKSLKRASFTDISHLIKKAEEESLDVQVKGSVENIVNDLKTLISNYNDPQISVLIEYINEFILSDLYQSLDEVMISESSLKKISDKTSKIEDQIISALRSYQRSNILIEDFQNLINGSISEFKNLTQYDSMNQNQRAGYFNSNLLSAIYNLDRLQKIFQNISNNQNDQGIAPLQNSIRDFNQFSQQYYQAISNTPPVKNDQLKEGQFSFTVVFNVLYRFVQELEADIQTNASISHFPKEVLVKKSAVDTSIKEQQLQLSKEFLHQFKNLSPYATRFEATGTIFPMYIDELNFIIQELTQEINYDKQSGSISQEAFDKSSKLIQNLINTNLNSIRGFEVEYSALAPNIETMIQTVMNYVQQYVQFDQAAQPRENQHYAQMITELRNEKQRVLNFGAKAKAIQRDYELAISKLLAAQSQQRLQVSSEDAIFGLRKTAGIKKIWDFIKSLFDQDLSSKQIDDFIQYEIVYLNKRFEQYTANLDKSAEGIYKQVVEILNGLNDHPLAQIAYGLIPSNIQVENVPQGTTGQTSPQGGQRQSPNPAAAGNPNQIINTLKRFPPNMPNIQIQQSISGK